MLSRISNFLLALCTRPSQPLSALQGILLFKRRVLITHSLKVLYSLESINAGLQGLCTRPGWGGVGTPAPSAFAEPPPVLPWESFRNHDG